MTSQGILWLIVFRSHLNFGIEKHTLTRFYTAGFRFFSASFAFSCAVPDGLLSPSPLRDASMMRDDPLLYHLFMSPERMPCTVKLRICITSRALPHTC